MNLPVKRLVRFALLLLVVLVGSPSALHAAADVFHSADQSGVNPGGVVGVATSLVQPIYLYIDNPGNSTVSGTVCEDGDGAELCGFDLIFEGTGGIQLLGFVPAGDVVYSLTSSRLRLNSVEAVSGISGPVAIGELQVDTAGVTEGGLYLRSSMALDASLVLEPIAPREIVTVPEPGFMLLFGSGLLGLAMLNRHRRSTR
jgi:hypothetical protein